MSIEKYLKDIKPYIPHTKKEEVELFKRAKAGDRLAYEDIIQSNLRFVVSVAKKYQGQGIDFQDLIAEGNVGLLKAYEKFDVTRNFKFITYAVWWIRQSILNTIYENSKTIRIPLNKISNNIKASKMKNMLEQEMARPMSYEEMAEYIDQPEILNDLKYQYTIIDLDQPHTDNDKDLNSVIPDKTYYVDVETKEFREELQDILQYFPEREQKIVYMYYGIGYTRSYTLKEIGAEMHLTRERIRQIKEKVLTKLRKKKRAERLV